MLKSVLLKLFIFISIAVFAQISPAEKKLDKINELINKNKIDKAENKLVDLLKEYPDYGGAWDLLAAMHGYQYQEAKKTPNIFSQIEMTTTDEDGNEIENDSLTNSLLEMLRSESPLEKTAYDKYLNTLRAATLLSNDARQSSILLRNEMRKEEIDTAINIKALNFYRKAETEFFSKNYNKAAKFYKKALKKQPNFYKANLYLGDSYYFMQYYTEAIPIFKDCIKKYPTFLEPRKFLADAYAKEGLLSNAIETMVESVLIYPDKDINEKLEYYLLGSGQTLSAEWTQRLVLPNTMLAEDPLEENLVEEFALYEKVPYWQYYIDASTQIKPYCNEKGIITKKNDLTSSNYLEVYSWETMLNNNKDETLLNEARNMQELGYLDCYVFITCFHDDLYEQYSHFVQNHKDKILKYMYNVVITSE